MTLLDQTRGILEGEQDSGLLDEVRRVPRAKVWVHTASPVGSYAEMMTHVIAVHDLTAQGRSWRPGVVQILVAGDVGTPFELVSTPNETVEEETEAGAPSAALLLSAFRELTAWLGTTQEKLCEYVGISRSTVMAWKRDQSVHPRHAQIPALLGLWAAVSGAKDELGDEATLRLVYGAGFGIDRAVRVEELTDRLLDAADEASIAALNASQYDSATAVEMTVEEIEAGERALSRSLTQHLEGSGD